MSDWLIVMLPPARLLAEDAADIADVSAPYWARISAGRVVESGEGAGWQSSPNAAFGDDAAHAPLIALAPAEDAPVRFVAYENLAPAQAAAAARLEAVKHLLGPPAASHVVSGVPTEKGQSFPLCTTSHEAMRAWQQWLVAQGVEAQAIIPIAALVPPPEGEGLNILTLGEARIVRSAHHGFAGDPMIEAALAGEAERADVSLDDWQMALALAAHSVPLDLLSGAWKRKAGWQWDGGWTRWIKGLGAALILLSLAVPLVQMAKYKMDEGRADQAVIAAAAGAGVNAGDAAAAEAEIDRLLAQRADGPLAFTVPASALYAALADAPAVSLKQLSHRGDGTLTASIAGPRTEDVNPVLLALQARGYRITAQPMQGSDGQQVANITIRAVP